MFVHDFVRIQLPFDEVVNRFGGSIDPWMGVLAATAWRSDLETWIEAGVDVADLEAPAALPVYLGPARFRTDAAIVPIRWPAGRARYVAGIDADLEIVACGPGRTDIQLLGRYELPEGINRWTTEASLAHRIAVTAVRRFLELLGGQLERGDAVGVRRPSVDSDD